MNVKFTATGYWRIKNSDIQYQGDLYLNENEGGIALYIRIPNNGPILSYFELPLNIPFINGTTMNGAKITLVDCSRISTESIVGGVGIVEVYGYHAKFMLNGVSLEKEEDIVFSKLMINIPGINKWGGVSNYVVPDSDKDNVLIGLNRVEPIKIYSCNEYNLSYYLLYDYPILNFPNESIVLEQTPYLIIESEVLHSLDWFIETTIKMKRIIEIAIGVPLYINKITAESPKITWDLKDGTKNIRPIEIKHSISQNQYSSKNSDKLNRMNFLFNLNELMNYANFSKWQETTSTIMEPIIELYIDSLYNSDLSLSRHFLNMAQALETYHSRLICNGTLRDYKKRVETIVSKRPEEFKQQDRNFLLEGNNRKNNNITLRNRIADLILADYNFRFYTGKMDIRKFPLSVSVTRNYYTHYNQKQEKNALKGIELADAFYILRQILEYYLLKELGFEEKFIHKKIRERTQAFRNNIEIRKIAETMK